MSAQPWNSAEPGESAAEHPSLEESFSEELQWVTISGLGRIPITSTNSLEHVGLSQLLLCILNFLFVSEKVFNPPALFHKKKETIGFP